jgi:hypothetical protein
MTTSNREALAWLQEKRDQTLGAGLSHTDSIDYVFQIYQAGAREVVALDIARGQQGETTGKLIIYLPEAAEQREQLFQWYNIRVKARGWVSEADRGQPYLFLILD